MGSRNASKYDDIIAQSIGMAAGSSATSAFVPILDSLALSAIWSSMLVRMIMRSDRKVSKETALRTAGAAVQLYLGYLTGNKALWFILKYLTKILAVLTKTPFLPVAIAVLSANSVLMALLTFRVGRQVSLVLDNEKMAWAEINSLAWLSASAVLGKPSTAEVREVWALLLR